MGAENNTTAKDGQSSGEGDGAGDGGAVSSGLERKNQELLAETKKSKEERRLLQARLDELAETNKKLAEKVSAHEKEKLSEQDRLAADAKEAREAAAKLAAENQRLMRESLRSRYVADAARRGVVGEDVQEFVADKVLAAATENKDLSLDEFFEGLKAKNPAFFLVQSTVQDDDAGDKQPKQAKKSSGGPPPSESGGSAAAKLAAYEKAKAAFEASPESKRDVVLLHAMLRAKKEAGR